MEKVNLMDMREKAIEYLDALVKRCVVFEAQQGKSRFDVVDPACGAVISAVPLMDRGAVEGCINAAHDAQAGWAARGFSARAALLKKWHALIAADKDALAALLTLEQGKPLAEAAAEINATLGNIAWSAERCADSYEEAAPSHVDGAKNILTYEAIGVVGAITPWNFPSAMVSRKAAPALAAGCAVVLKPAEDTPLSALALCALAHQAGIPRDVFSVVTLDRENAPLFSDVAFKTPKISMVSFTGSTAIGKALIKASAEHVTKLSLELGGNAPFIIREDADIDAAVEGAFASKFRNAGQTCICANRIYIHEKIYDDFQRRLVERVSAASFGGGFTAGVEVGPVINARAHQRLCVFKAELESQGARALPLKSSGRELGALNFAPLVYECDSACSATAQEIFGPSACLYKFSTDEEAAALANATEYGLAAYVYGRDPHDTNALARQLHFGMVGINELRIADASIPFGGMKQSGLGREGGQDSLKNFMNLKYFCRRDSVLTIP
jgi:succinate-semialdehyde dehydrogenase/glutarate-semialdehyde dehydrogenase